MTLVDIDKLKDKLLKAYAGTEDVFLNYTLRKMFDILNEAPKVELIEIQSSMAVSEEILFDNDSILTEVICQTIDDCYNQIKNKMSDAVCIRSSFDPNPGTNQMIVDCKVRLVKEGGIV